MSFFYISDAAGLAVTLPTGDVLRMTSDNPDYDKALRAVLNPGTTEERLRELMDAKAKVEAAVAKVSVSFLGDSVITVNDDGVFVDGEALHTTLTARIMEMARGSYPVDGLIAFLKNLLRNPSNRAVRELYTFLLKSQMPLTPDGNFIAFKIVGDDYHSIHTNPDGSRINNAVGQRPSMPRWKVDENSSNTCSTGLHACSQAYLPHYGSSGSRVMLLKINPADVVSIPIDYDSAKMRVCAYEVIGEIMDREKVLELIQRPIYEPGDHSHYMAYNAADAASWHDQDEQDEQEEDDAEFEEVEDDAEFEDEDEDDAAADDLDAALNPPDVDPLIEELNAADVPADGDYFTTFDIVPAADLYVRDTHAPTVYYPAMLSDIRSGETLYTRLQNSNGTYDYDKV